MESTTPIDGFCHACATRTHLQRVSRDYVCATCGSTFVELPLENGNLVGEGNASDASHDTTSSQGNTMHTQSSINNNIFQRTNNESASSNENFNTNSEGQPTHAFSTVHISVTPGHAPIVQQFHRRLSPQEGTGQQMPLFFNDTNLQPLLNNIGTIFATMLGPIAMSGGFRRPPASAAAIERLPRDVIKHEQVADGFDCAVCLNAFEEGDDVLHMPCRHIFHAESCLLPWLRAHANTCPTCRTALPTDDPWHEYVRQQRMQQQQ